MSKIAPAKSFEKEVSFPKGKIQYKGVGNQQHSFMHRSCDVLVISNIVKSDKVNFFKHIEEHK